MRLSVASRYILSNFIIMAMTMIMTTVMTTVIMVLLVNKALFTAFRICSKAVANSLSYPSHRAVRTYLYL